MFPSLLMMPLLAIKTTRHYDKTNTASPTNDDSIVPVDWVKIASDLPLRDTKLNTLPLT